MIDFSEYNNSLILFTNPLHLNDCLQFVRQQMDGTYIDCSNTPLNDLVELDSTQNYILYNFDKNFDQLSISLERSRIISRLLNNLNNYIIISNEIRIRNIFLPVTIHNAGLILRIDDDRIIHIYKDKLYSPNRVEYLDNYLRETNIDQLLQY